MNLVQMWRKRRRAQLKEELQGYALWGVRFALVPPPDMSFASMHRAHRAAVMRGERIGRRIVDAERKVQAVK